MARKAQNKYITKIHTKNLGIFEEIRVTPTTIIQRERILESAILSEWELKKMIDQQALNMSVKTNRGRAKRKIFALNILRQEKGTKIPKSAKRTNQEALNAQLGENSPERLRLA